ncbi:MAG: hypothetical protein AAF669_06825 [Pseudomonadota bacterium]
MPTYIEIRNRHQIGAVVAETPSDANHHLAPADFDWSPSYRLNEDGKIEPVCTEEELAQTIVNKSHILRKKLLPLDVYLGQAEQHIDNAQTVTDMDEKLAALWQTMIQHHPDDAAKTWITPISIIDNSQ